MNQSGGNFTNFEKSPKIKNKSYGWNFFRQNDPKQKDFISIKKNLGVRGTLKTLPPPED